MKKDSATGGKKFEGEPYIKIGNLLVGAIINSKNLLTNEGKVFMVILFKTIGFQKDMDWLNYNQICKFTGIKHKTRISEAVKNLIEKKLVTRKGKYFKVNQNFEEWLTINMEIIDLIKEVYKSEKLQNSVTPSNDKLQKSVTAVTKKRNSKLQNSVTPSTDNTYTEENITDNNIYSHNDLVNNFFKEELSAKNQIEEIFNFWNSKKIITHKTLTEKIKGKINSKLNEYSKQKIIQAIDNYWQILSDNKYFFSYRWTLEKFLQRGFEEFKDLQIAKNNYLKGEIKNGKPKKHFEYQRDYSTEERKIIDKTFYS